MIELSVIEVSLWFVVLVPSAFGLGYLVGLCFQRWMDWLNDRTKRNREKK